MVISSLINALSLLLEHIRTPLLPIPGILLFCTAFRRPGFSSILMSAKVFADMNYVEPENDEVVKGVVYNLLNRIKLNIHDDGVCFVIIPPGNLQVQLNSGNALGPLVLLGSNINYVFAWAIIR